MASVRKREWTHKGETKTAWVVVYTDQSGKRRMKTFDLKKDADKHRTKVEVEIERGEHVASGASKLMRDLNDDFLRYSEQRMRIGEIGATHYASLRQYVVHHINPTIGGKRVADLTYDDVLSFKDGMAKKGLAINTQRSAFGVLKQIEEYARKRQLTKKSVCLEASSEFRQGRVARIRTFSEEEAKKLLVHLEQRQPRGHHRSHALTQLFVLMAIFCGLRLGEIIGLTLGAIDLESSMIAVRHNMTRFGLLKAPKSDSGVREVPMPPPLREFVRTWIAEHYIDNPQKLLVTTPAGNRMRPHVWYMKHWYPLLRRAGFGPTESGKYVHFHALRHFFASAMIESNVSIPRVTRLIGHSNPKMTLGVYAHLINREATDHVTIGGIAASLMPPKSDVTDARARHGSDKATETIDL